MTMSPVGALLDSACQRFGVEVAYEDAESVVSFHQLREDVAARTRQFQQAGLQGQERVFWCPKNDYTSLVNFWSILETDAVCCPLSHRFPESHRWQIIGELGGRWLENVDRLTEPTLRNIGPFDRKLAVTGSAAATIVLSSGSSGIPKAVVHDWHAHVSSATGASTRAPLHPGNGWLWALPVFHVGGLAVPIRCLLAGARVVGVSRSAHFSQAISSHSLTHASLVPTQLRRLMAARVPLDHLESILLGGMAIPRGLLEVAIRTKLPVQTTYGLTEMASQVTTSEVLRNPTSASGSLLPGRELHVASDGEIFVRGETLCLGYARQSSIHRVTNAEGWFATRDRGEWTDGGELRVLGRMDNMFISGGENIYPEAIEEVLQRLSEIHQAIVVPRKDAEFGHRPVAFVDADQWDPDAWSACLRQQRSGFELPVEYFTWPKDAELAIKPDRQKFRELASD